MRFKPELWSEDDPLYAPCTNWTRDTLWWKVPKSYRQLGYAVAPMKLPGKKGDGRDAERAAKARSMTRQMLDSFGHGPAAAKDTWAWLIGRYRRDEFSPLRDVKANTATGYDFLLKRWEDAIGTQPIAGMTYEAARKLQKGMIAKGRSVAYVSRMFTMLRIVAHYGSALRNKPAIEATAILQEMRIQSPQKRTVVALREHAIAAIAVADARGLDGLALGLLLQWWLALRAVEVRGQYFEITEAQARAGGVVRESVVKRRHKTRTMWSRWQDGLTWDMISPDFMVIEKVISKTARSKPEPTVFSLADLPDVRDRLARLARKNGRVGPVILTDEGLPYTTTGWTHAWSRLRKATGIPEQIAVMDLRAGAITEAARAGVPLMDLRDMATHSDAQTTNRYVRSADHAIAKVIALRNEK